MPATARQTRKEIRQSIGMQMGAVNLDAGSVTHSPSETAPSAAKLIDQALSFGGNDEHRGKWLVATDSNDSVEIRRVSGSSPDERSLTVSVPFSRAPDTGWTYELWDEDVSPVLAHQYINDALAEVTRKGSITAIDLTAHTGGGLTEFRLDSAWTGVKTVEWRSSYSGQQLESFDKALGSLSANVTVLADTQDRMEGDAAAQLQVAAGASSGEDLAASTFAAVDIHANDRIQVLFKTEQSITSSNFQLQLMEGSTLYTTFNLPATSGDSWTLFTASISTQFAADSITGIRVRTGSSDGGAKTLWLDDLVSYKRQTDVWQTVPRDFWTLDQGNRIVRIKDDITLPYANLQLTGVRPPALLTSDSAVSEIDPQYIVHSALAKMLRKTADRRGRDVDAAFRQADYHEKLAQAMRLRWSMSANIRWVED